MESTGGGELKRLAVGISGSCRGVEKKTDENKGDG